MPAWEPAWIRLLRFRQPTAPDDCWLWSGARNPDGYGIFALSAPQRAIGAHRAAYELFTGAIPSGYHVDHACHAPDTCSGGAACLHRRCVNPAHLEAVTPRENWSRSHAARRYIGAWQSAKTHCPYGHPYDTQNTVQTRTQRKCRACLSDYEQNRRPHRRVTAT